MFRPTRSTQADDALVVDRPDPLQVAARLAFRSDAMTPGAPLRVMGSTADHGVSRSQAHQIASHISDEVEATVGPYLAAMADAASHSLEQAFGDQVAGAADQVDILAALARSEEGDESLEGLGDDALTRALFDVEWGETGEAALAALLDDLVDGEAEPVSCEWAQSAAAGLDRRRFAAAAGVGASDIDRILRVAAPVAVRWAHSCAPPELMRYRDRWFQMRLHGTRGLRVQRVRPLYAISQATDDRSLVVPFVPAKVFAEAGALVLHLDLDGDQQVIRLAATIRSSRDVTVDGGAVLAPVNREDGASESDTLAVEVGSSWLHLLAVGDVVERWVNADAPLAALPAEDASSRRVVAASILLDEPRGGGASRASWDLLSALLDETGGVGVELQRARPDDTARRPIVDLVLSTPTDISDKDLRKHIAAAANTDRIMVDADSVDGVWEVRVRGVDRPGSLRRSCDVVAEHGGSVLRWTGSARPVDSPDPAVADTRPHHLDIVMLVSPRPGEDFTPLREAIEDRLGSDSTATVGRAAPAGSDLPEPSPSLDEACTLSVTGDGPWSGVKEALTMMKTLDLNIVGTAFRATGQRWMAVFAVVGATTFEQLGMMAEELRSRQGIETVEVGDLGATSPSVVGGATDQRPATVEVAVAAGIDSLATALTDQGLEGLVLHGFARGGPDLTRVLVSANEAPSALVGAMTRWASPLNGHVNPTSTGQTEPRDVAVTWWASTSDDHTLKL